MLTLALSMPLIASIASTEMVLTGGTAMVLPTMSAGDLIGALASETMPIGFFWYWVPMILNGAPCSAIALIVVSGVVSVRSARPAMMLLSGITSGPPER